MHTRCKCPNETGRVSHTTSALCREAAVLHKCLSPSVPDPPLYLQEATSTEMVGSELNYGPTPLLASHKHRCAHHLFKLDISANQNWDSIQKNPNIYFHSGTHISLQSQGRGSPRAAETGHLRSMKVGSVYKAVKLRYDLPR